MYRFLVALIDPYVFLLLCMGGAISLSRKSDWGRYRARRLLIVAWFGLLTYSLPAIGFWTAATLEWQVPRLQQLPEDIGTIVVLGGYADTRGNQAKDPHIGSDTLYRCFQAARLYRQRPECLVVVSGGKIGSEGGPSIASAAADVLVRMGVPRGKLLLEERSTTTYENAVQTSAILAERGINKVALVTEAIHLPRSIWCFEACGIQVWPSGCEYRTRDFEWSWKLFVPNAHIASDQSEVWHEWLGIAWYAMSGRFRPFSSKAGRRYTN